MSTIALLGDSILDNRLYVDSEPDTAEHLRRILGPLWTVKLLAVDGSVMADVYRQSAALAPSCDVAVLSVGGNDAIDHLGLLEQTADSVASVIDELDQIATSFAMSYGALVSHLRSQVRRLIVCTVYEPPLTNPRRARLARVPIALFADRICNVAGEHSADVIDLRRVCTEDDDFVAEIEPSALGARKIAEAIAASVLGEETTRCIRVFAT
jgi:hypothetical protein